MANFWAAGAPTTSGITVDKTASVVVSRDHRQLSIAVSDPTQLETGTVTVTVEGAARRTLSVDSGVTVLATTPDIKISVPVQGAAGKSFVARFRV